MLAAGLAIGLLCVTGCAGDAGTEAFSTSYESVTAEHRSAMERAQAAARAAGPGQSPVAVYQQLRDATREALESYGELEPPKDAAAEFSALTRGLRTQVEALDRVLQAAEKNDAVAARAALADYASALGAWQSARQSVEATLSTEPAGSGP